MTSMEKYYTERFVLKMAETIKKDVMEDHINIYPVPDEIKQKIIYKLKEIL